MVVQSPELEAHVKNARLSNSVHYTTCSSTLSPTTLPHLEFLVLPFPEASSWLQKQLVSSSWENNFPRCIDPCCTAYQREQSWEKIVKVLEFLEFGFHKTLGFSNYGLPAINQLINQSINQVDLNRPSMNTLYSFLSFVRYFSSSKRQPVSSNRQPTHVLADIRLLLLLWDGCQNRTYK